MKALLVCGGEAPSCSWPKSELCGIGLVCAADSGLDTLISWGIDPDIIVGDMDSVSDPTLIERFPRARVILANSDKDTTDTELGLDALTRAGADKIVIAGGGGGRLDHLLAIRTLFERRPPRPRPSEWHTARDAVYLIREGESRTFGMSKESAVCGGIRPRTLVSVFPLASGASLMASEGLRWPLEGLDWGPGDCGVSNETVGGRFSVSAGHGDLLVVISFTSNEMTRQQI